MDYQYAYFVVSQLLRDLGFTQKMLSEELKKRGIIGYSEGNLSRGKPKYHSKKKVWRRGSLSDGQLKELLKGLNALLLENGITMEVKNGNPIWYDRKRQEQLQVPTLQYEEMGQAQTDESDAVKASEAQTETEKLKIKVLQSAFPADGALAQAIASHLEKGGSVEILVINLNRQMI
jgi:hypothetical protein